MTTFLVIDRDDLSRQRTTSALSSAGFSPWLQSPTEPAPDVVFLVPEPGDETGILRRWQDRDGDPPAIVLVASPTGIVAIYSEVEDGTLDLPGAFVVRAPADVIPDLEIVTAMLIASEWMGLDLSTATAACGRVLEATRRTLDPDVGAIRAAAPRR